MGLEGPTAQLCRRSEGLDILRAENGTHPSSLR
jgi:hypothetical protein